MANVATVAQIVAQAKAAAAEFDAPIVKATAVELPSEKLLQSIFHMSNKQAEIMTAARGNILASAALDAALAALETATFNLNRTAAVMVSVTMIVSKTDELVGHGTGAVNAIKSVT